MGGQPDAARLHTSFAVLDGHDPALLNRLSDSGIAALAADNYAVEQSPAKSGEGRRASLPLHEHFLFKTGLPLGEMWHLGPLNRRLRAQARSGFLLTAPPLGLPGAVGSPVTPVATVSRRGSGHAERCLHLQVVLSGTKAAKDDLLFQGF